MARINAKSDFDSPSFDDRVLLLSTTHFGLATPVLNIQREKKADALAKSIIEKEVENLPKGEKLTLLNITESDTLSVQLKLKVPTEFVSQLKFKGRDLEDYAVVSMDEENKSVFVFFKFKRI